MTEAQGGEDRDSMTLNVDFENGEKVTIEISYPKDHGLSAIMAIHRLGQPAGLTGLLEALSHDPSVAARLDAMGAEFVTDDEDDES